MMAEAEIPQQYKACIYDAPGKISTKVDMLDMPEPGPGEVLIKLYVHGQWRQICTKHILSMRNQGPILVSVTLI